MVHTQYVQTALTFVQRRIEKNSQNEIIVKWKERKPGKVELSERDFTAPALCSFLYFCSNISYTFHYDAKFHIWNWFYKSKIRIRLGKSRNVDILDLATLNFFANPKPLFL